MQELFYFSKAETDFDEYTLGSLLLAFQEYNKSRNITGMLIFDGRTFFQILEGAPKDIGILYKKIATDKRHSIEEHWVGEKEQRIFNGWSMAYKDISKKNNNKNWWNLEDVRGLIVNPTSESARRVVDTILWKTWFNN